jgi:membrane-associated phospholipid phosphatase
MRIALILLVCASPVAAEGRFTVTPDALAIYGTRTQASDRLALRSDRGRHLADVSSWSIALAEAVPYTVHAWKTDTRICAATKAALTGGTVQGLKRVVRRERPDHSDRLSFPSGHSAYGALMTPDLDGRGGKWNLLIPGAIIAGRVLAARHDLVDVLAGAAIGFGVRAIPCR